MPGKRDCSSFCITSSNNNINNQMTSSTISSSSTIDGIHRPSPSATDLYQIFEPITALPSDLNNSLTTYGYIGAMLKRKDFAGNAVVENMLEKRTISENATAKKAEMWTYNNNNNNQTVDQNGKEVEANDPETLDKQCDQNDRIIKQRNEEHFEIQPRRNAFIEPGSGMRDVPAWLKSLRLHKYTPLFQQMTYAEMLGLTDEKLEGQGVTKGARNKIVLSVLKLADRTKMLKQFEKELSDPERMGPILQELKLMLQTPIRPYPYPGHQELYQSRIDGIDIQADQINNENIAAHFTRVLGKVYTEFLTQFPSNCEGLLAIINHIFDRCLSHEAFTQAQKRRIVNWKQIFRRAFPTASRRFSSNSVAENPYKHYYNNHNSSSNKQRLPAVAAPKSANSAVSKRDWNPRRENFGGSQPSQSYPLQSYNNNNNNNTNNPRRGQEPQVANAFNASSGTLSPTQLHPNKIQLPPRGSHPAANSHHPRSQYSFQCQQPQQQGTMMSIESSSPLQHQMQNNASTQQQQQQHLQTAAMLALINGTINELQQQNRSSSSSSASPLTDAGFTTMQDLIANLVAANSAAAAAVASEIPEADGRGRLLADSQHLEFDSKSSSNGQHQHQHQQTSTSESSPTIPSHQHQHQHQFPPASQQHHQQPNPPQRQPIFNDLPMTTINQSAFFDQGNGVCPPQQQSAGVGIPTGSSSSPRRIAGTGQRWFGIPTSSHSQSTTSTPKNPLASSETDPWTNPQPIIMTKQRNTSGESSNGSSSSSSSSSSGSSLNGLGIGKQHGPHTQTSQHQQRQPQQVMFMSNSETSSVSSLSSSCSPPIATNNNNNNISNNNPQFLRSSTAATENGSSPTQQQQQSRRHYFPNNINQVFANCDTYTNTVVSQQKNNDKGGLKSVPHSFTDLQAYNFELEALEPPEPESMKTIAAAANVGDRNGLLTHSLSLDFNARMEYLSQRVAEAAIGNHI